jgi:FeS assembly protein IscX
LTGLVDAVKSRYWDMGLTWNDADDIARALVTAYPEQNPLRLSFPKLRQMVATLADFVDNPDASNEAILEQIQMAWREEKQG